MEVIIACGLADPKGAWGAFLVKGLYDMRLFLHVAAYKGETMEELVGWALKGIEILPMPESEVDECEKLVVDWVKRENIKWYDDRFTKGIAAMRNSVKNRAEKDAKTQWAIIVHRWAVAALKIAAGRNDLQHILIILFHVTRPYDIWSDFDELYTILLTRFIAYKVF